MKRKTALIMLITIIATLFLGTLGIAYYNGDLLKVMLMYLIFLGVMGFVVFLVWLAGEACSSKE